MEKLSAFVQSVLPQHLISRLTGRIAAARFVPLKKLLIHLFIRLYDIDLNEAANSDPDSYPSFNALFTRALAPGARQIADDPATVVSPADGRISQFGEIAAGRLMQAKDRQYSVDELLGIAPQHTGDYDNGRFVTIYLAPHDYHRIHMPLAGRLRQMTLVPGRLFSVSPATTRAVLNLYGRNERVVFYFDCECGPVALVMVGAMNVGSVETVHAGVVAPGGRQIRHWHYEPALQFDKGQELARFNLGSTAIVLLPGTGPELAPDLQPEAVLRVGQAIARIQPSESR